VMVSTSDCLLYQTHNTCAVTSD